MDGKSMSGGKGAAGKPNYKEVRRIEAAKQRTRKLIVLSTLAVVVVAFVIFAIVKANSSSGTDTFNYDAQPVLGQADAPVKLVEFGDFKCPACQYFEQTIFPQLKKDYIDTGKVKMYFMNMPFIYDDSVTAALAGEAVFRQNNDAFWKFYEALYKNQKPEEKVVWATPDFLVNLAKQENLPLDFDKLRADIQNQTYLKDVNDDNSKARSKQVASTPTLFINGAKFEDVFNYNSLKAALDKAIGSK